MLRIDQDAALFDDNGEQYLQIMFAEVDEPYNVPLDATSGIFLSFEISDVDPIACPIYYSA